MAGEIAQLRIKAEMSPHLTSVLGEIEQRVNQLDEESPLKQRLQALFDSIYSIDELLLVECKSDVARVTNDLLVLFYPGDGLLRILAALRTGDANFLIVEIAHVKALLLVGAAVDSQPHHTSQQEAPNKQEGLQ